MKAPLWVERRIVLRAHDEALAAHGGASGVRDMGLLESALARPQNLFAYGEADVAALAAAYAFGVVRNHPFVDGNKRIAAACALLFLALNDVRVVAPAGALSGIILDVAAGTASKDDLAVWLRAHLRPWRSSR